jgi:uncharacterized delta-60 repeat protein
MKANHLLLKEMQRASFVLILITILVASTTVLAAEGVLDSTFGTDGIVVTDLGGPSDMGVDIILQPDGKIIIAGTPDDPYYGTPIIVRYNSDGTLDTTFGTDGKLIADIETHGIALLPNGKLILGGEVGIGFGLARYTSNGTLDPAFGTNGIAAAVPNDNFYFSFGDLAIQSDAKIVIVGTEITGGHHYPSIIARFNKNGTLDETFGFKFPGFPDSLQDDLKAVAFQSDGKIIVGGNMLTEEGDNTIILGRLTGDQLDPTFGTNGTVVKQLDNYDQGQGALAIQSDDKIVIAGTVFNDSALMDDLFLARYNKNGTLDTTFGGTGIVVTDLGQDEVGKDLAIQSDGKIILAGQIHNGTSSSLLLVRYNSNGSLDTSFGDGGKVTGDLDTASGLALQPDGKAVVVGVKDGNAALARYEGTLPPTTTINFHSKAASDGWILESAEFGNAGGSLNKAATTFYVGDDPKDKQYRSIISFNTASLPDNAIIISAQVKVKRQGVVGTDPFATHGSLLLDIRNGLFNNDLDLRLPDFAAPASSSTPETVTPLTSSWYAANLSTSNLAFVNKYGITQFRLRFGLDDNDDQSADYMKFFTGESAVTANRPQLVIKYILP